MYPLLKWGLVFVYGEQTVANANYSLWSVEGESFVVRWRERKESVGRWLVDRI